MEGGVMGIVIFGAMALYLLISIGVVVWAIGHAKNRGKSTKRWGWGAVLVMYLIPFWDWIPTVAVHQYYCAKDSGFWIYKTLDQWKAENPGVMEGLVANKGVLSKRQGDMTNYTDTYFLNQRFNWEVKHNGKFLFNRWRHEEKVVDAKSSEVLARYINFSTAQEQRQAGWSGWKFWLDSRHCIGGDIDKDSIRNFRDNFYGSEK
jgi:hypothetical protein